MIFLGLLIFLFVLAFLFVHLTAYSIRWLEESRKSGDDRGIFEAPFSSVRFIILEIICSAGESLLSLADLILTVCRAFPWQRKKPFTLDSTQEEPPLIAPSGEEQRPIVLLHGAGMRGLAMYPLARKLRREGRTVHLFTYWPPWSNFNAYARQLRDHLDGLCRQYGYREFDAVGHSLGGLVVRRYLALFSDGPPIKRIVTIGTPHGGSELWRFAFSSSARDLKPGGEFLQRLDQARLPEGVEATAISAGFDQLVIPNANARWESPSVTNVIIQNAGHSTLLFLTQTFEIVRKALP